MHVCVFVLCICMFVCVCVRPERLIDSIVNRDYGDIIDEQTIIVMSISYILSKEIPSETRLRKSPQFSAKCNVQTGTSQSIGGGR